MAAPVLQVIGASVLIGAALYVDYMFFNRLIEIA